jgi:hypothetical protein
MKINTLALLSAVLIIITLVGIFAYKVNSSNLPEMYGESFPAKPEGLVLPKLRAMFLLNCSENMTYKSCENNWRHLRIDIINASTSENFTFENNVIDLYK